MSLSRYTIRHRIDVPFILALSLGIGLIPDLFHALTYSRITSLTTVLLPGVVIGGLFAYAVMTWIQTHQSNGVLHLRGEAILTILTYLAVMYVIPWGNFITSSAVFCSMILAGNTIDCGYKFFVLQSTTDFVLWVVLYMFGIRFESTSKQRLIYQFHLGKENT